MYEPDATEVLAVVLALSVIVPGAAVASHGAVSDAGAPEDVAVGDERQTIDGLTVELDEAGADGVDVYLNVTALADAGVGLDSLNVEVGPVDGAVLVDANVNRDDGYTTVRLTFDADADAAAFTVESVTLTQLDTSGAAATDGLAYDVAHSDGTLTGDAAPDGDDARTGTFAIVDGDGASGDDTPTDGATDTPTDGTDDTPTDGSSDDAAPTDEPTDDGVPGFGAAVALFALAVAAVAAAARG